MANRWIILINTLFANIQKGDTKQEQCDESVAHCIAISTFFKNATLLPACHDTVTSRGFGEKGKELVVPIPGWSKTWPAGHTVVA